MQPREHPEEVAVLRRRVGDAGISQQQREHGPERGPQNHRREYGRDARSEDALHEDRDHEIRLWVRSRRHELAPRHDPDDREIDRHVNQRHRHRAQQDRAWNHAARILYFVADVADIVVAQVIVDADARRRAKPQEKADGEVERPRREIEREPGVEVQSAGHNHHDDRENRTDPQGQRNRGDGFYAAIQQCDVHEPDRGDHQHRLRRRDALPDVAEVLRETDISGRDFERAAQDELPDEEKPHQPAHRCGAVAVPQIAERAARSRQSGPELAPHHAVAQNDDQRDRPAEHRLGAAERGHEQRNRDERPDADHVRHVERRGVQQAEAAHHWWGGVCHVFRFSRSSRCRRTSGHSAARMLYITTSRALPSRRMPKWRITPSFLAPRASMARCDRKLKLSVRRPTTLQPSVSKAWPNSSSLHVVLTCVRWRLFPYQVWPISTRSIAGAISWYRVDPTIAPLGTSRTTQGSMCPSR